MNGSAQPQADGTHLAWPTAEDIEARILRHEAASRRWPQPGPIAEIPAPIRESWSQARMRRASRRRRRPRLWSRRSYA